MTLAAKQLKKWSALLLAVVMLMAMMTACGGDDGGESSEPDDVTSVISADESEIDVTSDADGSEFEGTDPDVSDTESTDMPVESGSSTSSKNSATNTSSRTSSTAGKTSSSNATSNTSSQKNSTVTVNGKTYKNGNVVKTYTTGNFDYIMEVPSGRDITVLQLTDPQIMDTGYESRCFRYMRETINKSQPDLILITGDVVYGRFDSDGEILKAIIRFMEEFEIPWAPVFGNHDAECPLGVDWICQQYMEAENCLFVQRELTGNGNYTIGIKQDNTIKRVVYMMDSNGCTTPDYFNDHSTSSVGFGNDQKVWFTNTAKRIKKTYPKAKITVAFHIQIQQFLQAFAKYGFDNSNTNDNPINLDTLEGVADGDFGYIGRILKSPWNDAAFFDTMKQYGVDSILVGHEHCNSASVVYQGIRFQYGQKSSTYDRANYLKSDGTIVGTYDLNAGAPIMGGTVLKLSKTDAAIKDAYIQYWDK